MSANIPGPGDITVGEFQGKLVHVNPSTSDQVKAFVLQFGPLLTPAKVKLADDDDFQPTTVHGENIMVKPRESEFWVDFCIYFLKSIFAYDAKFVASVAQHRILEQFSSSIPRTVVGGAAGAVPGFQWHPYLQILAIAKRSSVFFYNAHGEMWDGRVLEHRLQKNITCMSWCRNSGGLLAVGCDRGVFLWDARGKSSHLLDIFQHIPEMPIDCLAFSPDGRLLATGSLNGSSVYVWDVSLRKHTTLKAVNAHGIRLLRWAPNGRYLFVATT